MLGKSLSNKVFLEIVERYNATPIVVEQQEKEGIVTSINEFISLLNQANNIYNKTFNITTDNQLIISEDFSGELLARLNNQEFSTDIDKQTLRDIRVITYLANEEPGIVSSHSIDGVGIRNIKPKFACVYDDPEYTGYSILRFTKDIDAVITFKVWGNHFHDIRERSALLRKVIDTNTWFFKHKGLREIVWLGSYEEELWDAKNIAKFKTEKYRIKFAEVKELKEKNLEQVAIQIGLL
ncbi:MAG: hypothetical protein RBR68_13835 [Tenuifilaceae bacterium]|nr:hypothetical protein [Tenuifilaceae bacterium]